MKQIEVTQPGEIDAAVLAEGVVARRGRSEALRGVDVAIPAGAACLLSGPNGAGKTTFLRTLVNLTRVRAGHLTVLGRHPALDGPGLRARIGWMPDAPEPPPGQTIEAALRYLRCYRPGLDREYASDLLARFRLRMDRRTDALSRGEGRKLGLLFALAHRPDLLLLDEPFEGMDPHARDAAISVLVEHLADTGCTAIIATHHPAEVEAVVEHVVVLRDGRAVVDASAESLRANVRRYRIRVPDGGSADRAGPQALLREGAGLEQSWVVAGPVSESRVRLSEAGLTVLDERALGLEEIVRIMLTDTGDGG
jgi:ABC-2 type transport system ATP-binding protein